MYVHLLGAGAVAMGVGAAVVAGAGTAAAAPDSEAGSPSSQSPDGDKQDSAKPDTPAHESEDAGDADASDEQGDSDEDDLDDSSSAGDGDEDEDEANEAGDSDEDADEPDADADTDTDTDTDETEQVDITSPDDDSEEPDDDEPAAPEIPEAPVLVEPRPPAGTTSPTDGESSAGAPPDPDPAAEPVAYSALDRSAAKPSSAELMLQSTATPTLGQTIHQIIADLLHRLQYTFFNQGPAPRLELDEPVAGEPITGRVVGNDPDDPRLTYRLSTEPVHGTVDLAADGSFAYHPDTDLAGTAITDSFTIIVDDGPGNPWHIHGLLELVGLYRRPSVRVPITIGATTPPPFTIETSEPEPGSTTYRFKPTDPDNPLTVAVSVDPQHGETSTAPDGAVTYTPDDDYAHAVAAGGPDADSFTVTVTDSHGTAITTTITVTVAPQNVAPEVDPEVGEPDPDTGATTVTFPATDAEGDALTYTVKTQPAHGTVEPVDTSAPVSARFSITVTAESDDDITFTFKPDPAYAAQIPPGHTVSDMFTVTVNDGHGGIVDTDVFVEIASSATTPPPLDNSVIGSIGVSGGVSMVVSRDGKRGFVGSGYDGGAPTGKITVVDLDPGSATYRTAISVISTTNTNAVYRELEIAADGKLWTVGRDWFTGESSIAVIDINQTANPVVKTFANGTVGSAANDIAFTTDGTRAYLLNETERTLGDGLLVEIDTTTYQILHRLNFSMWSGPQNLYGGHLVISGDFALVTSTHHTQGAPATAGTVIAIDTNPTTTRYNLLASLTAVGPNPTDIALTPDGTRAVVANGNHTVSVIHTNGFHGAPNSDTVITIGTDGAYTNGGTDDAPEIAITADSTRAYITHNGTGTDNVAVVDLVANTVIAATTAGAHPTDIAIAGDHAFITTADNITIIAINPTPVATVDVPDGASMVVSRDGKRGFIGSGYTGGAVTGSITVVDLDSASATYRTAVSTITTGNANAIYRELEIAPDGKLWAVGYDYYTGQSAIAVVDINQAGNPVVKTFAHGAVGMLASDVAFTSDGTRAYLLNETERTLGDGLLFEIDTATYQILHRLDFASLGGYVNTFGNHLVISGDFALITSTVHTQGSPAGTGSLLVVDTNPATSRYNHVAAQIGVGPNPTDIELTPDGTLAVVANSNHTVSFIPTNGFHGAPQFDAIVAIATDGAYVNGGTDDEPEIAITADGTRAYITHNGSGTDNVSVIDLTTKTLTGAATIANHPTDITIAGNHAYITTATNITIIAINPELPLLPVAVSPDGAPAADGSVTYRVENPEGGVEYSIGVQPLYGSLTPGAGNTFVYKPSAAYAHEVAGGAPNSDTFTIHAANAAGQIGDRTVTVTIAPQNELPEPDAPHYGVDPVTGHIVVTFTGTDPDGDTVAFGAGGVAAEHGNIAPYLNGYRYIPNSQFAHEIPPGQTVEDSFGMVASDGHGGYVVFQVPVTITSQNVAPNVEPQAAEPDLATGAVEYSFDSTDSEGDTLTYSVATGPLHGRLEPGASEPAGFAAFALAANPSVTYTYIPNRAYAHAAAAGGPDADQFTLTVDDGHGGIQTLTVHVTVTPLNGAPTINDPAVGQPNQSSGATTVTPDDDDPDGDTIAYTVDTPPAHGRVDVNADGTFTYTPDKVWAHSLVPGEGQDTFKLRADDGHGAVSIITVPVTVPGINTAPTVTYTPTLLSATTGATLYTPHEIDPDDDTLTYVIATFPEHGTIYRAVDYPEGSVEGAPDGAYVYVPDAEYAHAAAADPKTDGFALIVSDGYGGNFLVAVSVAVHPINTAPTVQVIVGEPDVVTGKRQISFVESDADDDTLTHEISSPATLGGVVKNGDGTFTYTPPTGHGAGVASFSITVSDGHGFTHDYPVGIHLVGGNLAPVVEHEVGEPASQNGAVVITLSVTDPENDTVTIGEPTGYLHGGIVENADGTYTYTPTQWGHQFIGGGPIVDSLTFVVDDGHGAVVSHTVPITIAQPNALPVVNFAPTPVPDLIDGEAQVTVSYRDPDGDQLTYTVISGPTHGVLTPSGGGSPVIAGYTNNFGLYGTYTPNVADRIVAGPNTVDTIVLDVSDGVAHVPVTITIPVVPLVDNEIVTTIFGGPARGLVFNGSDVYITGSGNSAVYMYRPHYGLTEITGRNQENGQGLYIALTSDGRTGYIANEDGTVSVFDTASNAVIATVPVPSSDLQTTPTSISVGPDGNVYVGAIGNLTEGADVPALSYHLVTGDVDTTVYFRGAEYYFNRDGVGYSISAAPDSALELNDPYHGVGSSEWQRAHTIRAILGQYVNVDGSLGDFDYVEGATFVNGAGRPVVFSSSVAISADGKRAYVAGSVLAGIDLDGYGDGAIVPGLGDGQLLVIDADPTSATYNTVVANIPLRTNPVAIAVTPDGKRVYVANEGLYADIFGNGGTPGSVTVIDADPTSATYKSVLTKLPQLIHPRDIEISADGTHAYVATDNGVEVVSIVTTPAYSIDTVNAWTGTVTGSVHLPSTPANPMTYTVTTPVDEGGGSVTLNPATGGFIFHPSDLAREIAQGKSGPTPVGFTITADDGQGNIAIFRITASAVEPPYVTLGDAAQWTGVVHGSVEVADPKGQPPTFAPASGLDSSKGTVTVDPVTGDFVFTPSAAALAKAATANAPGADKVATFTLTAYDDLGGSVTLSVTAPIDPGYITGDTIGLSSYLTDMVFRPDGRYAYIADARGNIFAFNTATREITTIRSAPPGADQLGRIVVNPNSRYAYVSHWIGDAVEVIDMFDNSLQATIHLSADPAAKVQLTAAAFSPDGSLAYVAKAQGPCQDGIAGHLCTAPGNLGTINTIEVIDTTTNTRLRTIDVGEFPGLEMIEYADAYANGIALDPDGKYIYLTSGASILLIDPASGVRYTSLDRDGASGPVQFAPGGKAYIYNHDRAYPNDTTVTELKTVVGSISVLGAPLPWPFLTTGATHIVAPRFNLQFYANEGRLEFNPVTGQPYIINAQYDTVDILNADYSLAGSIPVEGDVVGMEFSPNGAYTYVLSTDSVTRAGTLTIIVNEVL